MAFRSRRRDRAQAGQAPALVGVVDHSLPATLPMEKSCADLYLRLYPTLVSIARRRVDPDSATDIVNEVFLSFWQRWDTLKPEQRSEGAITNAVKNETLEVARRLGRQVELTDEMADSGVVPPTPPPDTERPPDLGEVGDAILDHLSSRCRDVYLMVNVDGLSYKQTAAALDIGYESVKTYLKRANTYVREALVDGGYQVAAGQALKALPPSSQHSEASDD